MATQTNRVVFSTRTFDITHSKNNKYKFEENIPIYILTGWSVGFILHITWCAENRP